MTQFAYDTDRWEAFTEHERAAICVALVGHVLMAVQEGWSRERMATEVLLVAKIISELNLVLGGDAVDESLLARLQEMIG